MSNEILRLIAIMTGRGNEIIGIIAKPVCNMTVVFKLSPNTIVD